MRKKNVRGVLSIALSFVIMARLFVIPYINSFAEAIEENSTGFESPLVIHEEITEEELDRLLEEERPNEGFSEKTLDEGFHTYNSYKATDSFWSQFSQPYYNFSFSKLNANQRYFYNVLYDKFYKMIDGGSDCTVSSSDIGTLYYLTPIAEFTGLTEEEVQYVGFLLMYDRPELYYINQVVKVYDVKGTNRKAIRFGVYNGLQTGSQRASAASWIKSKIKWYLGQVDSDASAYDIEKKIHDLLCANCYYGNDKTRYSQSCASVFLNSGGETVCAGYSEAFALLCYACGIPALSVTSSGHEWNQVFLGGYWYAVDLTWDDTGGSRYKYFNKSDATFLRLDKTHHVIEEFWSDVGRPSCPYDYGSAPPLNGYNVYRLYNPNSGEHFYTFNYYEEEYLSSIGWIYEGIGWYTPFVSNTPVFRMYNPNAGDHHYTMNYNEVIWLVSLGWNYEGISWYSDDNRNAVLYRLYNPNAYSGAHHYTLNSVERDVLVNAGWRYEGIAWYGL